MKHIWPVQVNLGLEFHETTHFQKSSKVLWLAKCWVLIDCYYAW